MFNISRFATLNRMLVPADRQDQVKAIATTVIKKQVDQGRDAAANLGSVMNEAQFGRVWPLIQLGFDRAGRSSSPTPRVSWRLWCAGASCLLINFANVRNVMTIERAEIVNPGIAAPRDEEEAIAISSFTIRTPAAHAQSADRARSRNLWLPACASCNSPQLSPRKSAARRRIASGRTAIFRLEGVLDAKAISGYGVK